MALAALSIYPPDLDSADTDEAVRTSWKLVKLDPVLNATVDTAAWARKHIPQPKNA